MSMLNQSVDEPVECPLCMEPLEVDDLSFFPCTCGYQICRFCWHRIRMDENGLCPACRKPYAEDPADFKPLSKEDVARMKAEKKQKNQQKKQKITENRKSLANVRVVQRNLVFVLGLPARLADIELLKRHEYFGKYGKIVKVVVNHNPAYTGTQGTISAYVTYQKQEDALRAIQAVNNINIDGRMLKSSLGTTKYCSLFLKNLPCNKPDCMYLHDMGEGEASFTKEEMQQGKHQEFERRLHEQFLQNLQQSNLNRPTPSPPLGQLNRCLSPFPGSTAPINIMPGSSFSNNGFGSASRSSPVDSISNASTSSSPISGMHISQHQSHFEQGFGSSDIKSSNVTESIIYTNSHYILENGECGEANSNTSRSRASGKSRSKKEKKRQNRQKSSADANNAINSGTSGGTSSTANGASNGQNAICASHNSSNASSTSDSSNSNSNASISVASNSPCAVTSTANVIPNNSQCQQNCEENSPKKAKENCSNETEFKYNGPSPLMTCNSDNSDGNSFNSKRTCSEMNDNLKHSNDIQMSSFIQQPLVNQPDIDNTSQALDPYCLSVPPDIQQTTPINITALDIDRQQQEQQQNALLMNTPLFSILDDNSSFFSATSCLAVSNDPVSNVSVENDWLFNEEPLISDTLPPVDTTEDWQAAFGFRSVQQKVSDESARNYDDLGFDPVYETQKALAEMEMLEKEQQMYQFCPHIMPNNNNNASSLNGTFNTSSNGYSKRFVTNLQPNNRIDSCTKLLNDLRFNQSAGASRVNVTPPGFHGLQNQINSLSNSSNPINNGCNTVGIGISYNPTADFNTRPQQSFIQQQPQQQQPLHQNWGWSGSEQSTLNFTTHHTSHHRSDLFSQPPPGFGMTSTDGKFVFNNYI